MPMAVDAALDAYLNRLCDNVENLYICSQEPANFLEASSTYALGVKATPTIGAAANDTSGRKRTVSAISDGSVTASGSASHLATTDNSASELCAAQALAGVVAVTLGQPFTLTAFDFKIPDPT